MKRLYYIFLKRHVHVKPLDTGLFGDTWLILSQNWFEAMADDYRRYGLRVAIENAVGWVQRYN